MVVDYLDVLRSSLRPAEADPVLVVDSDRMLPSSISLQLLQPQARKRQGRQRHRRAQLIESSSSPRVELAWQDPPRRFGVLSVEDVLSPAVLERDDQASCFYPCSN